ncbi:MAG: ABC transporter substrate-binding protein [Patescibacteria group bacterium]
MNKSTKIIAAIIILLAIVGVVIGVGTQKTPHTVKIGAALALTGNSSAQGELAKRGVEIAIEQLKSQGINNIEVVFEDTQTDPKLAVNAWKKLTEIDHVKGVLAYSSPVSMALAPLANSGEIPLFGIVSAPAYQSPDDYTYRIIGSAALEIKAAESAILETLKAKRLAIIFMNNDYGKSVDVALKNQLKDKINLVAEESFLPTDTDYRSGLTKIKSANPDLIYIAASGKDAGIVIKQAKALGINGNYMCSAACENQDTINAASGSAEGMVVATPTGKMLPTFEALYQQKFNDEPIFATLRMYDATMILGTALNFCEKENFAGSCVTKNIAAIKDFPGASYAVNFDRNGDINDQFVLKIVKEGKWTEYDRVQQ